VRLVLRHGSEGNDDRRKGQNTQRALVFGLMCVCMISLSEPAFAGPPQTFTVTFVENDSGSDQVSTYELGTAVDPPNLTLFSKLNPQFSNAGHTFTGWNTAANGSGTEYGDGASYSFLADLELYAQWTTSSVSQPPTPTQPESILVGFVANGGSGSLAPLSGVAGVALTLPSPTNLLRPGYSFTSWNTDANGTGTSYASGASLTLSSSLTLYAQWKATPTSVLYGDVGVFDKNSTGLTKTLQQQVEQLAATIRMKKFTKVALYGYTAQTGLPTLDAALSHDRALSVARYLRLDLRHLHVRGVDIRASGEGAISSSTSSLFSRVEVFVS